MNLKDQTPFFNDPPPWYYRMIALVFGFGAAWNFALLVFIVFQGHEYWPILIFAPTGFFAITVALRLWRRAQAKKNERATQKPTTDA